MPIITLTTDFGTLDYYTGALKGVILQAAPQVQLVDITHDIEPHDIQAAAFTVRQTWRWYGAGTVHLAIVDPGVGTLRRIVVGKYGGQYLVAPDNGLITLLHHDLPVESLHSVENADFFLGERSATFHGRDRMAPVAAHLANGLDPSALGPAIADPVVLPIQAEAVFTGRALQGQVLHVDRFGTLVTNIRRDQLGLLPFGMEKADVRVNGQTLGTIRTTFADVALGEPAALFGGAGLLEIVVNQGRAVDLFGSPREVRVDVR